MKNGYFSADGREYVITDPNTPRPWHNYLANDEYLVNITQYGTGASFFQPKGEGLRVNVTEDRDGSGGPRFVYLRDNETGEYWTVTGAPEYPAMEEWECRVGLGYQINRSLFQGIEAQWRVFVPEVKTPCEYWTVTLTNKSETTRKISAFPYLEMHLTGGSTLMDFIAVLGGHFDSESNAVFGINSCVKFPPTFKAFLASDAKTAGATVSRDEFLGHYHDYHHPAAVVSGNINNPEAGTEWLGASLRHEFTIEPGNQVTFNCLVGVTDSVEKGKEIISEYLSEGRPEKEFSLLQKRADTMCEHNRVQTGDEQFDRWMNIWLKDQLHFLSKWGRVIGRGYRDILQDSFGHRLLEPETARNCIKEVFSKQFPSGKCIRAWRLPTAQLDLQDYADSPSWMIMALSFYLKETGDYAILEEVVPYLNPTDPYADPVSSAAVWDHVVLAQKYLLSELGTHGLCKIYNGDWCDTMNGVGQRGQGESVMLTMQVKWGCDMLAELAEHLGKSEIAAEMSEASASLNKTINTVAWDGKWYVRAFDDDGLPVGTSNPPAEDCGEGKVFLNAQSWALISGIASQDRRESCLDTVEKYLNTGYGLMLNWPAYTSLKPRIGQMSAMTPGFYENGSVYVHGNCFWVYALAKAGYGEKAWDAFKAILPDTENKPNADTEPFAIPNFYIGPQDPRKSQRNLYLSGWRTGSAAWLYMAAMEWILGIRAEYDGLRIEPKLPAGWNNCTVNRMFRGVVYEITIQQGQAEKADNQHYKLSVDGAAIEGCIIRPFCDGKKHTVLVEISNN